MEEITPADSDDGFDQDSEQDLHSFSQSTYPDPDTVVGNPWWSKAHPPSSPAARRDGLLHDLERSHGGSQPKANPDLSPYHVTTSDGSVSQVLETRLANPYLVGRDDHASESDFALPEEDDMYVLR